MAKYFKGRIILTKPINSISEEFYLAYYRHCRTTELVLYDAKRYSREMETNILEYIKERHYKSRSAYKHLLCQDEKVLKIFKEMYDPFLKKIFDTAKSEIEKEVIFELIKDTKGNFYGREVLTNRIFPLFFYDKNIDSCYKTEYNPSRKYEYKLIISNSLSFTNMLQVKSMITLDDYVNPNVVLQYKEDSNEIDVAEEVDETYFQESIQEPREEMEEVKFKFYQFRLKYKHNKKMKELAEKRSLESEKRKEEQEEKRLFKQKINNLADMNAFQEDFEFANSQIREVGKTSKDKIYFTDREQQSVELIFMDKIELGLSNLKEIDKVLFKKYAEKYKNLVEDNNINKFSLSTLLGDIEFYIMMGKTSAENILESLDSLKKEYLENLLTGNLEKNTFTFEKLNIVQDFILKNKKRYEILSLRKILKNLSLLYIIEIYSKKDSITLEELEKSYFADNLSTIVTILKAMKESNIFEYNQIFELEELSCSTVFEMIKSIEFNQLQEEQVKELVKNL